MYTKCIVTRSLTTDPQPLPEGFYTECDSVLSQRRQQNCHIFKWEWSSTKEWRVRQWAILASHCESWKLTKVCSYGRDCSKDFFKLRLDINFMHYFQDNTFTDKFEPWKKERGCSVIRWTDYQWRSCGWLAYKTVSCQRNTRKWWIHIPARNVPIQCILVIGTSSFL
jgi:hypothetical protein